MILNPFFICFVSRSGSTLLSRLLTEKYGCVIPPEQRFLLKVLKGNLSSFIPMRAYQYLGLMKEDIKFNDWGISKNKIVLKALLTGTLNERSLMDSLIKVYLEYKGYSIHPEPKHFGFKKGEFIRCPDKIMGIYPNAKFICLIRDGRAVYNSQRNNIHTDTGKPMESDYKRSASKWLEFTINYKKLVARYPDHTFLLHYEDILENPRRHWKRLPNS